MPTSIPASIEARCKLKALSVLRGKTQADMAEALIDADIDRLEERDADFVRRIVESEMALADRRAEQREVKREAEDRRWDREH